MNSSIVHFVLVVIFMIVALLIPIRGLGQTPPPGGPPPQPDATIDAATRTEVINKLVKELNDGYVFPEVAKQMETDVRAREKNKEYDALTSARAFGEKLTTDLQAISKDKHLRVAYSANPIPERGARREPTAQEIADDAFFLKRANYAFQKVERLEGNIGYIELTNFFAPVEGAETVAAAFAFIANTDALIIDLRRNGGGDPAMVQLICSYLFGEKSVHLNSLYWRAGDRTEEFWTKPVSGKKYLDRDVYVLTSARSFSGAEEFTYNLKNLKRATIVGETTGGGANPGGRVRLTAHFGVFVPSGRAISPITKTNWEGVGVEPDVKVAKELALKTAYAAALAKSAEKQTRPEIKAGMKDLVDRTNKEIEEMKKK